jgi:glycosyltransferase involved in cell wall biosynthesis
MRILVVIYEFPPVGGGGGQAARDICQGLVNRGHEVLVLTSHLKGLPRQQDLDGIQVLRVPSARRLPYQASLADMSAFIMAGALTGLRQARHWHPDIIHVHFAVPSGPVAWIISRITRIPYVLTAHLGDVPSGVPEKTDDWFRWIYPFTPPIWRESAQVVAVSQHTRQLAERYYPVDIQVIPNGVDLSRLDPGPIRVGDPPLVVFAGRFMPQKNPLQFVQTLAELKDLNWQCAMIGDGALRPDIEDKIQNLGLNDRIKLTGWLTPDEVTQWLSKSDILFMPSLSEGLPVVGVQSLAMGLCIVASEIGGFIDLVDQGVNGYLVETGNTQEYKRALQEVLSAPERLFAFRQASRKKAHDFDIQRITQAYESLFMATAQRQEKKG